MLNPIFTQATQNMTSARILLRDMDIKNALLRITNALDLLKQAREELQMPLQRLQAITMDQIEALNTSAIANAFDKNLIPDSDNTLQKKPEWLETEFLKSAQTDVQTRTSKLKQFIEIAENAPPPETQNGQPVDENSKQQFLEQQQKIRELKPHIDDAVTNMQNALQDFEHSRSPIKNQAAAAENLNDALELFADIKQLIEIIYANHTPLNFEIQNVPELTDEQLNAFPSLEKKLEFYTTTTDKNIKRLQRLEKMFHDEAAKQQEQADQQQIEQQKQLMQMAENYRAQALQALNQLSQHFPEMISTAASDPEQIHIRPVAMQFPESISAADSAQRNIENLRILFFTIIEHLKELARQQEKTLDFTADLAQIQDTQTSKDNSRPLTRQKQHEHMASQLTDALKEMADKAQQAQQPEQQQQQQNFSRASSEMQLSAAAMRQSIANLDTQNPDYKETLERQNTALKHIINAINILQPPKQQEQEQEQEQNQDQQQQQNLSKEQANRKLQQIKEQEENRKAVKKHTAQQAVEKDW